MQSITAWRSRVEVDFDDLWYQSGNWPRRFNKRFERSMVDRYRNAVAVDSGEMRNH